MISTTANEFCYTYSTTAGDVPFTLQCASGQKAVGGPVVTTTTVAGASSTSSNTPTPTVNPTNNWLQHWIVSLVPGNSSSKFAFADSLSHGSLASISDIASLVKRGLNEFYSFNSNYTVVAPGGRDRLDLENLRHPTQLPAAWLTMMNLNVSEVRKNEALAQGDVDDINNNPNYTSVAALRNFNTHNSLGRWTPQS